MSQPLPYDGTIFDKKVKFEGVINTFDDSDIGYCVEFDLKILII